MTQANQDSLASVEAENQRKRSVLAALKAQESTLVSSGALGNRKNALEAESKLLDSKIDDQLNVLAGHAGVPSTDLDAAKAEMLASIQKSVKDAEDAVKAARDEAKAQEKADREATQAAEQKAAEDSTAQAESNLAQVTSTLSGGTTVQTPAPAEVIDPTPSVIPSTQPADSGTSTVPTPTPASQDSTATDAGKGA